MFLQFQPLYGSYLFVLSTLATINKKIILISLLNILELYLQFIMSMLLRFKSNIMLRQKLDYSQRFMLEQVRIIEKAEIIYYKSFCMSPRRYRKKLKRLDPSIATCLNIITVELKVQNVKLDHHIFGKLLSNPTIRELAEKNLKVKGYEPPPEYDDQGKPIYKTFTPMPNSARRIMLRVYKESWLLITFYILLLLINLIIVIAG